MNLCTSHRPGLAGELLSVVLRSSLTEPPNSEADTHIIGTIKPLVSRYAKLQSSKQPNRPHIPSDIPSCQRARDNINQVRFQFPFSAPAEPSQIFVRFQCLATRPAPRCGVFRFGEGVFTDRRGGPQGLFFGKMTFFWTLCENRKIWGEKPCPTTRTGRAPTESCANRGAWRNRFLHCSQTGLASVSSAPFRPRGSAPRGR